MTKNTENKKHPPVNMKGADLAKIRKEVFDETQPEFADRLGVNFRTIVRLESLAIIPEHHARHVKCIAAAKK